MLNSFKIGESTTFKFELYKNNSTLIGEIPNEYISTNFKKSLEEINSFEIKIPKYISINGKKTLSRLYNKIFPKMQVVVTLINNNHETKERYILLRKNSMINKNLGYKEFIANSFEYTLRDKKMAIKGVFQLKTDSTFPTNGIMDEFVKQNPNWKIGTVDNLARTEVSDGMEMVNEVLFKDFTSSKVATNGLLWEKDITTTVADGISIYLNIQYNNLSTYTADNKKLLENDNIHNAIEEALPMNCKKVRAYHYSGVGNRYGIKYIFTLADNSNVERICTFTNVINKTCKCDSITFNYETGKMISYNNVKFINLDTSDSWYDFLRDVESQFNCVFLFDGYNRTISVVSYDNLGKQAPIELSFDSGIIDLSIDDNNEYPNALKVIGKDNLSIANENIYGGEIIYNFDWYKKNIMSDDLINNWNRYETYLKTSISTWKQLKSEYMLAYQRQTAVINEIQSLENQLRARKSLLAGYINAGDTVNQTKIQAEIDTLMKKVESDTIKLKQYTDNVQKLLDDLTLINNEVKIENATDTNGRIFSNENLLELNDIITIEEYSDDYYTTSYGLYNNAIKILADKANPHFDFKISCANFIKLIQNPLGWNNVLSLGDYFPLKDVPQEILNDIGESNVRLVNYTLDINKKEISNLEFTNKTKRKDYSHVASNIGKTANTVVRTTNTFGNIYEDARNTINQTKSLRQGLLDLASTTASNRTESNIIDIGGYGAFFIDSTNQNNGLFITNSLICITQDNFKTCKTAISSDGITAELLIGREILGEKLLITNENANFKIDGEGLKIYEGSSEIESNLRIFLGIEKTNGSGGKYMPKLRLIDKDGQTVISSEGLLQNDNFNVWNNVSPGFPLRFTIPLDEGVSRVKKAKLFLHLDRYRGFTKNVTTSTTTTTSGASNTTTTSSSGSHRHLMFNCVGSERYSPNSDGTFPVGKYQYANAPTQYSSLNIGMIGLGSGIVEDLYTYSSSGSHSHELWHTHPIDINLTTTVDTGIMLYERASNVSIAINGVTVSTGIYEDCELDITPYIQLNTNNVIEMSSATNGYLEIISSVKYFSRF